MSHRTSRRVLPSSSLLCVLGLATLAACSSENAPRANVGNEALAGKVCSPSNVVEGLDISEYQKTVDFGMVASSGRAFVITRVSDGLDFPDATFAGNYAGIKAAGMIRGSYQYFEPAQDPVKQANMVLTAIGNTLSPGDLPPVIDLEKEGTGLSAAQITAAAKSWLDTIESALGVKPIIYTGNYYWTGDMGDPQGYQDYPMWIAGYPCNYSETHDNAYCPTIPDQWSAWTFWQYSDGSKQTCATDGVTPPVVPGAAADDGGDRDFFAGTLAQLMALAGGGTAAGAGGSSSGTGGSAGIGGAPPGSIYKATYVSQSWPLSEGTPIQLQVGQTLTGSIDLKNAGNVTWPAGVVKLAPIPRDQSSEFQATTWLSATRVSTLTNDVAPGETGHFEWDLSATTPGMFAPYFGLVAEGIVWFADSGGPPDNDIQVTIEVSPGAGQGTGGMGTGAGVGGSGGSLGGSPQGMGGTLSGTGAGTGVGGASAGKGGAVTTGQGGAVTSAGGAPASAGHASGGVSGSGGSDGSTAHAMPGGAAGSGGTGAINVVDESSDSSSSGGCVIGSSGRNSKGAFLAFGLALGALARRRKKGASCLPAARDQIGGGGHDAEREDEP